MRLRSATASGERFGTGGGERPHDDIVAGQRRRLAGKREACGRFDRDFVLERDRQHDAAQTMIPVVLPIEYFEREVDFSRRPDDH